MFVKGYGCFSFAKTMGKKTGKTISKNLSRRYSQNLLDHAKESVKDALKISSKRVIQKAAEATGDLIGNKTAIKITRLYQVYNKLIQKQLQTSMIMKYLKNDIYLQKKDRKLLII